MPKTINNIPVFIQNKLCQIYDKITDKKYTEIYKNCIDIILENIETAKQQLKLDNITTLIIEIIKTDNLELYDYFYSTVKKEYLDIICVPSNIKTESEYEKITSKSFEYLLICCLEYSMPIFYKIYDIVSRKHSIFLIPIIKKHIFLRKKFYKNEIINTKDIFGSCYFRLFYNIKKEFYKDHENYKNEYNKI